MHGHVTWIRVHYWLRPWTRFVKVNKWTVLLLGRLEINMLVLQNITTCPFGQVKYKFNEKHFPEWHFYLPPKEKELVFVLKVICPQYTFSLPDLGNCYILVFQNACPNLTFTCPGKLGKCLCSTLQHVTIYRAPVTIHDARPVAPAHWKICNFCQCIVMGVCVSIRWGLISSSTLD